MTRRKNKRRETKAAETLSDTRRTVLMDLAARRAAIDASSRPAWLRAEGKAELMENFNARHVTPLARWEVRLVANAQRNALKGIRAARSPR